MSHNDLSCVFRNPVSAADKIFENSENKKRKDGGEGRGVEE